MSADNTPHVDWSNIIFEYNRSPYNVRCTFKDGKWGDIEISDSEYINIHMSATCLQYGQEIFEGLKAFRGKDGKVRIFRMDENARRFVSSAIGMAMEPLPEEKFKEMARMVVRLNKEFIPPYGTGASLYLRPLEIGITPRVGVRGASEFLVVMFASPVGPYFRSGFKPVKACLTREHDRVAPKGTGAIKTGVNYGASLYAGEKTHDMGYGTMVYLDPKEKLYIDECSGANFFAIKDNTYITPDSESILPSITNKSLQQLAKDNGMKVECRKIPVEELSTFEEVSACGTGAVCSPIGEIDDLDTGKTYVYGDREKAGPLTTLLYDKLRSIQYGEAEDTHNWCEILSL